MDWLTVWQYRDAILSGLILTIWLSCITIVGSTIIGVLIGCLRESSSFFILRLTNVYVEVMRNIPVVVKLFFLYFIVGMPAIMAAFIGIAVHQSAYIADTTSAGIRSIAKGQLEAGLSLGHSYRQIYGYLIIPQMIRIIIPSMITQYVAIIKHTAIVSLIAVRELTFETQEVSVQTFRGFEAATVATILYIIIAIIVIGLMTMLHRRLDT